MRALGSEYLLFCFSINVGHFQHKCAAVKSLRRSGRISNILLYKTLQWKLSFSFRTVFIWLDGNEIWKFVNDTISLSKCLKYPGFIFLCPKIVSKQNPRKKKSLNYPNTIPKFFFWIWLCSRFFLCPKDYPGKKQTPWTIQIVSDTSGT